MLKMFMLLLVAGLLNVFIHGEVLALDCYRGCVPSFASNRVYPVGLQCCGEDDVIGQYSYVPPPGQGCTNTETACPQTGVSFPVASDYGGIYPDSNGPYMLVDQDWDVYIWTFECDFEGEGGPEEPFAGCLSTVAGPFRWRGGACADCPH